MTGTTIAGSYTTAVTLSTPATQNPATISGTGRINVTATSGTGVYGSSAGAWSVYNSGTVIAPSRGVFLTAGGTITNEALGLITGYRGIEIEGAAGQVTNGGSVGGGGAQGIKLDNGGSVTNRSGGTITGAGTYAAIDISLGGAVSNAAGGMIGNGVLIHGAAGTVTNSGRIASSPLGGISLLSGGEVLNSGLVGDTGYAIWSGGPLDVTNASGGILRGTVGIGVTSAAGMVSNTGMIIGSVTGVTLMSGGTINNAAGALIQGYKYGVVLQGTNDVVTNSGTIFGGSVQAGITSFSIGLSMGGNSTLRNSGVIGGRVSVGRGGLAVNYAGAKLGALSVSSASTLINAGIIGDSSDVYSVRVDTQGGIPASVINQSGGTMSYPIVLPHGGASISNEVGGVIRGIGIGGPAYDLGGTSTTIVNDGSISTGIGGTYLGYTDRPGYLTVLNTGTIVGGYTYAVNIVGFHGKLVNTGTIEAAGGATGVELWSDGIVGLTLVNAGLITSASTAVLFTHGYGLLEVDPGAEFRGLVDGGPSSTSFHPVSTLELAVGNGSPGTLTGFGSSIVNFSSIAFDPEATWTIAGNTNGLGGTISGFAPGDTIDLVGLSETVQDYTADTLTLVGDQTVTLNLPGTFTTESFRTAPDAAIGTDIFVVPCFLAGTMIATPDGEVPVERLVAGDLVLTLSGKARRIVWAGTGRTLATRGRRSAATPVIVRKGALSENVPNRDLHVTKGHALYLDGVLIPVEYLVNHSSVAWDDRAQEVQLYHLELETHDVLIANGAPAESYRDDGNRWLFQNANTGWKVAPKEPCARLLTGGPVVDAIWRRLRDRTGVRPSVRLTADPDLHLLVDGSRLDAFDRSEARYVFRLSARPRTARIRSRSAAPLDLGIARDPRVIGVAIHRIVVAQARRQRTIAADAESLVDGYHAFEAADRLRWTLGDAAMPTELFAGMHGPSMVALHLGPSTQYLREAATERVA